jgi:hypothetical protein
MNPRAGADDERHLRCNGWSAKARGAPVKPMRYNEFPGAEGASA